MSNSNIEKQTFAWNYSSLENDKDYEDFNELMDILIKCSSLEEFNIMRDLLSLDKDVAIQDKEKESI